MYDMIHFSMETSERWAHFDSYYFSEAGKLKELAYHQHAIRETISFLNHEIGNRRILNPKHSLCLAARE